MIALLVEYRYLFLFFGMVIFGETVFFPAAYLVYSGTLEFWPVLIVSLFATLVADNVWYFIGRIVPREKLLKLRVVEKRGEMLEKSSAWFDKYGLRILFYSKFLYGTRVIVQIVCGMRRLSFLPYLLVNTLGLVTVYILIFAIIFTTNISIEALQLGAHRFEILFLVLALLGIIVHICVKSILKKI